MGFGKCKYLLSGKEFNEYIDTTVMSVSEPHRYIGWPILAYHRYISTGVYGGPCMGRY